MKRFFAILILLTMVFSSSVLAEVDLSDYSDDQLQDLFGQVQLEMIKRKDPEMSKNPDFANWLINKSGIASGEPFEELLDALIVIKDGRNSGRTGTREFAAALQFVTGKPLGSGKGKILSSGLSSKDWTFINSISAGKKDDLARRNALSNFQSKMIDAGLLDENGALTSDMAFVQMSDMFNEKYGTHFGPELFYCVLHGLNDYIEDPNKKYQIN